MLGSLADRRAFERDDALIAFGGGRLVEGDRKETFAEQREQGRVGPGLGQPLGVELEVAAQLAAAIIADEQLDRPAAGLRLQRQLALLVLQRRTEQAEIGRESCRESMCQSV